MACKSEDGALGGIEHESSSPLPRASARLYRAGWMRGTSGNISRVIASEPWTMEITASGIPKDQLTEADLVLVDEQGNPRAGQSGRPSAETRLHSAICRATGAESVVHVHAVSVILAADLWPAGVPLEGIEQLKGLGLDADGMTVIPVVPNSQDMEELSRWVLAAYQPNVPAVIVANHGCYAWGADIQQAVDRTESLDWLAQLAIARYQLSVGSPASEHTTERRYR